MTRRIERVPVLPADTCPAGCRPLALVEERRLLGFTGDPAGGPCPWCLAAFRADRDPGRPRGPLLSRAGRRLPGGGHEMETGRAGEAIDRLASALAGRAERFLWIEPETLPRELATIPHRVARLGLPVHLFRVPHAPWLLARRLSRQVSRERLVSLDRVSPADGDLVLAWDPDPAEGWAREEAWLRAARARGALVVSVGPLAGADGADGDVVVAPPPGWDGALALVLSTAPGRPAPGGWSLRRFADETGLDPALLERVVALVETARSRRVLLPGAPLAAQPDETLAALAHLARVRDFDVVVAPPPPLEEPALPGEGRVVSVAPGGLPGLLERLPAPRTAVVVVGIDPLAGAPGAADLGGFLDRAGLVAVFGPWSGPVTRRADLVLPGPGPLARGGTRRGPGGAWRGRPLSAPGGGDVRDVLATWRAVGRRLGAPEALFLAPEDPGEGFPGEPGWGGPPPGPGPDPAAWRPDPGLSGEDGGLLFLGRRFRPRPAGDPPAVRLAPGTAESRDLVPGRPARARAGEREVLVRVEVDPSVPPGLVVYGAPDIPGSASPGILAPPPFVLGAVRPFRGELFPPEEGGGASPA